jgi:F-type H+-transporting ATPase subunit delta
MANFLYDAGSAVYAKALLSLAVSENRVVKVTNDFVILYEIIESSSNLRAVFKDPFIRKELKKGILIELIRKLDLEVQDTKVVAGTSKFEGFVTNLLFVLLDKDRFEILDNVFTKFLDLVLQNQRCGCVYVTTFMPLTYPMQRLLASRLKVLFNLKHIKLAICQDKELLGGFKVQMGSQMLDLSLRGLSNEFLRYLLL